MMNGWNKIIIAKNLLRQKFKMILQNFIEKPTSQKRGNKPICRGSTYQTIQGGPGTTQGHLQPICRGNTHRAIQGLYTLSAEGYSPSYSGSDLICREVLTELFRELPIC